MCGNIAKHESHEWSLLEIVVNSLRVGIYNVVGKGRFDYMVCFLSCRFLSSKLEAHMRSQMEQVGKGDWFTDGPAKGSGFGCISKCQLDFFEPIGWRAW